MHSAIIVVLSLIAGWCVNMAADALPNGKPFFSVWRQPLSALGCSIQHRIDCRDRLHALRTLVTWVFALGLGWLAYWRFGMTLEAAITALYAWFFLGVAVIDLEHRRVLNRMLLAAMPVVALMILASGTPSLRSSIAGAAIGFGVFLLAALLRPGGMGMGDVKLAGLIGLATGIAGVAIALAVGIVAGGLGGLVLMVAHRLDRRATMAYAPYLALGAWVALYFGADLWQAYST